MATLNTDDGTPYVNSVPANYSLDLYATAYGADPTGTVDSTEALNTFLLQCGLLGRKGRIPAGTYLISDTLLTHNTDTGDYFLGGVIEGDGRALTTLKWVGATDDGKPMMIWSRQQSALRDVSFDGDYKASLGLVVQNAQNAVVSVSVKKAFGHGIAIANEWPDEGLASGFNEECVIDRPQVDSCGYTEIQQIRLDGTGLGGTFTLTFDGNTTAPIAWNASAATVAAALLAANPGLDSPPSAGGGTGNNPFVVTGTLAANMFIELKGLAAGHHDTVTMDTALITGTITTQQTALTREGSAANGIHFFDMDDPEENHDNATMAIFEPACRQNSGSGLSLAGGVVKVWGGHFEGNVVYGIHMRALQPSVNGFSISNMLHWPYFEGNYVAGGYANYSTRDWIAMNADIQPFVSAVGADASIVPGTGSDGGYGIVLRGSPGYKLHLGAGTDGAIWQTNQSDTKIPERMTGVYDDLQSIVINANGPLSLTGQHNHYQVTLNADVTSVAISNSASGQIFTLTFVRGAAAHTVAWPAAIKWAGGVAPTLGTGAVGSADIVVLQNRIGSFYEVSRSLAVA